MNGFQPTQFTLGTPRVPTNDVGQDVFIYFSSAALVGLFFGGLLYVMSETIFTVLQLSPKYDRPDQHPNHPSRSVASYRKARQRRKLEEAKSQDPATESSWKRDFESQLGKSVGVGLPMANEGEGSSFQTLLEDSDSL